MNNLAVARYRAVDRRCVVWSEIEPPLDGVTHWFDPEAVSLQAQPVTLGGRGRAWYVKLGQQAAVLRQYQRGGWCRQLSEDRYFWWGEHRTRCLKEYHTMLSLANQGLPVPRPIAAMACRDGGLTYRAWLITERVLSARTLAESEHSADWFAAGQSIAHIHAAGVWHADLNVNNVLIDGQGMAWVIDFDRAREGVRSARLFKDNLARLARSMRKVCPSAQAQNWPALLAGYDSVTKKCSS